MTYWIDRNRRAQDKLTRKSIADTEEQLRKYYSRAMDKVIEQFEATYNKILATVAEGRQPTPADLYKLDSYWQMQGQLQQELQRLGDRQAVLLGKQFTQQFLSVYEAIAIPGQSAFTQIDTQIAQQMINQIWCADGKTWSQRIWDNTNRLREALNEQLISCLVTGKKPSELKKILQEEFNVSYHRADSLVRTEMSHIQTQAAQKRYTDYGIQEVEVWADEDERRCEVCGRLHQKRYPIGATMPIPAHPNCRCTIIPVVE